MASSVLRDMAWYKGPLLRSPHFEAYNAWVQIAGLQDAVAIEFFDAHNGRVTRLVDGETVRDGHVIRFTEPAPRFVFEVR